MLISATSDGFALRQRVRIRRNLDDINVVYLRSMGVAPSAVEGATGTIIESVAPSFGPMVYTVQLDREIPIPYNPSQSGTIHRISCHAHELEPEDAP